MKIPKTIKIGEHTWEIKRGLPVEIIKMNKHFEEEARKEAIKTGIKIGDLYKLRIILGHCQLDTHCIYLRETNTKEQNEKSLIHELLHAIWEKTGMFSTKEEKGKLSKEDIKRRNRYEELYTRILTPYIQQIVEQL